jgi:hypothetical protein
MSERASLAVSLRGHPTANVRLETGSWRIRDLESDGESSGPYGLPTSSTIRFLETKSLSKPPFKCHRTAELTRYSENRLPRQEGIAKFMGQTGTAVRISEPPFW